MPVVYEMIKKLITINTKIYSITNFYGEIINTFNAKEKDIIDTTIRSSVSKDSKLLIAELFSKVMENSNILKAISKEVSNIVFSPMVLLRTVDSNKLLLVKSIDSDSCSNTCIEIKGSSLQGVQVTNIIKSNINLATEEEIDSFLSVIEVGEMLSNLMDALGIVMVELEESERLLKPTLISEYVIPYIYKVQIIANGSNSYDIVKYLCDSNLNPVRGQSSRLTTVSSMEEATKTIQKHLKIKNNLCVLISKQERKLNSLMRDQ